jgi:hypothetical protein
MAARIPEKAEKRRLTGILLGPWPSSGAGQAKSFLMAPNEAGTLAGRQIQVNLNGAYSGPGSPTGVLAALAAVAGTGWILALAFWPAFAARQVITWRRSAGERRQQLKWLMGGAALALAGLAVIAFGPAQP